MPTSAAPSAIDPQRIRDLEGQVAAISRSQAVIEFALDGTILAANDNFLAATGYARHEVVGKHHRMFVSEAYSGSAEYARFWQDLRGGRFHAGEFERRGKGGRPVWIQATYNPILGEDGRPFKVVKYASDVTDMARARKAVVGIAQGLTEAALRLRGVSDELSGAVRVNTERTQGASSASAQVSRGSEALASATEQMSASIREIARNAGDAATMGGRAVGAAEGASSEVSKLGASSAEIAEVTNLITVIAKQTNLLALNATIEAARAGDAGRGFAVVASEVKDLAKQTALATASIDTRVKAIEADTLSTMDAIQAIRSAILELNSTQTAIAGAVEEQSATTQEMARAVEEASMGTRHVATSLGELEGTAQVISTNCSTVHDAADQLAAMARELTDVVASL